MIVLAGLLPSKAQYPSVPKEVAAETAKMMSEARHKSDSAWQIAYPIIQKEKAEENHYSWAYKPEDLPQAIFGFSGCRRWR
jgi:Pyruvate/2-oxoacid:ferredoxin oxidoreductase delta subunit